MIAALTNHSLSLSCLKTAYSSIVAVGVLATAAESRVKCYNKSYATDAVGEFSLPKNTFWVIPIPSQLTNFSPLQT